MKSGSFSSDGRFFSFEQRVLHIERLLISALILATSTYNLNNQNYRLETYLGENAIYLSIIIFFISYVFVIVYFTFIIIATSEEAGIQLVNFVFKHKSWIGIPLVCIVILSGILLLIFGFGQELKDILAPIIVSLIMIAITRIFKITAWIKERLEQKQLDEYD